jgi:hypothetical protein
VNDCKRMHNTQHVELRLYNEMNHRTLLYGVCLDNKLFSQATVPLEKLTVPKLVKELPVFHRVYDPLSLVPFLSQMNPVCAVPSSEYMSAWLSRLSHGSNLNHSTYCHCKTCVPG